MQTGEYHFVTESKNALFTDDEVAKGMAALRHSPSSGEPSVRVIDVQLCKYTFFKNPLSVFPDI
jgi:hypothetical protein